MKTRTPLLALPLLLLPAPAGADWLGFAADFHAGYVDTDQDATWAVGPQVALQLLGFEVFADLRFLQGDATLSGLILESDHAWDRLGLRYTISSPITLAADEAEIYADAAYVYELLPGKGSAGVGGELPPGGQGGLAGTAGLRFQWDVLWEFALGFQGEAGWHAMFLDTPEAHSGMHGAVQAFLKLDI